MKQQGRDDRSCDDASNGPGGNGMNGFTVAHDKLCLSGVSSITACLRALCLLFCSGADAEHPFGSKDDLRNAYKQFYVIDDIMLYVLMLHPQSRDLCARRAYTLLFGEVGAVYVFLRIVSALVFVLNVDFAVPVEAFFDDFWHWAPKWASPGCTSSLHFFLDAVGLERKVAKYVSPRRRLPLLGVQVSVQRRLLVSSDGDKQLPTIVFQNDEVKISRYVAEIRAMRQRAAQKQTVSQASRSKLGHKLCFAGEALHGRCGAAARKVLFASEEVPARLLRSVLTIWEQLLLRGRPREVPIVPCSHPPML